MWYDFDGWKFANIFSLNQTARSISLVHWLQRFMENILPFFVERNSVLLTTAQVRFSEIFQSDFGVGDPLISSIVVDFCLVGVACNH